MPMITGPRAATPDGIQENIQRLLAEGKTADEAVAIAYQVAEKEKRQNDEREEA